MTASLVLPLIEPVETEHLEFKEAKNQFDTTKLMRYCVAIANEGGGSLVLGVTDRLPRRVVNSRAFETPEALNKIKARIVEKLQLRVEATELFHFLSLSSFLGASLALTALTTLLMYGIASCDR